MSVVVAEQVDQPSDWIDWAGGPSPVPGVTLVEVKYRRPAEPAKGQRIEFPCPAWRLAWNHDGQDDDIIAYRIVQP